jgi:hypothetical protein
MRMQLKNASQIIAIKRHPPPAPPPFLTPTKKIPIVILYIEELDVTDF